MKSYVFTAIACLALLGCKEKVPSADTAADAPAAANAAAVQPAPEQGQVASAARNENGAASPARIEEIGKIARSGFWSETTEVCRGDHARAWLLWSVRDSGASHVVVYVVDKAGKEQHFAQGGPVGEKLTGPWLYPGITFKLRDAADGRELGSVQVAEKHC